MNKNPTKIGFENGRATIALDEHETSMEEWFQRWSAAFSELRKDNFIPEELIELVENFGERTRVQLKLTKVRDESGPESSVGALRLGIEVIGEKPKLGAWFAELRAAARNAETDESNCETTASDALAFCLRLLLRDLKIAEKEPGSAPVRLSKLFSRSNIGEIALHLLERCEACNYSPGHHLVRLFRELSNLQSYKQGAAREFDAREEAISIIAQRPDIGTRALAKKVGVHSSTVSRWRRKDLDFNEKVKRATKRINTAGGRLDEILRLLGKEELTKEDKSNLFNLLAGHQATASDG